MFALFLIAAIVSSMGAIGITEMNQTADVANNDAVLEGVSRALDSYVTQDGNAISVVADTLVTARLN